MCVIVYAIRRTRYAQIKNYKIYAECTVYVTFKKKNLTVHSKHNEFLRVRLLWKYNKNANSTYFLDIYVRPIAHGESTVARRVSVSISSRSIIVIPFTNPYWLLIAMTEYNRCRVPFKCFVNVCLLYSVFPPPPPPVYIVYQIINYY